MRRWLATIAAIATGLGCGSAPTRTRAQRAAATPPVAPTIATIAPAPAPHLPRLWLRGGLLHDATTGRDLAPIANPTLVELVAPDRLRVADSAPVVEGVLPAELALRPDDRAGLGLFVARETALHGGAADGPIIGRVVRGVYLPVLKHGAVATEVSVPGYYDLAPIGPDGSRHVGALRAFVATADLGLDETAIVPPVLEGKRIRSARLELEVEATSLTNAFTTTDCSELRILEERVAPDGRPLERVAQYRNGIEVVGWAHEDQDGARGGGACAPRASYRIGGQDEIPTDYVLADVRPPTGLDLRSLVRSERTMYIPLVDDAMGAPACHPYRFEGRVDAPVLVGNKSRIRLSPRAEGFWIYLAPYQIVATTTDRIVILAGTPRPGARVTAYHPADAEHWFFTKAACERDATRENASLIHSRR